MYIATKTKIRKFATPKNTSHFSVPQEILQKLGGVFIGGHSMREPRSNTTGSPAGTAGLYY
jgi:hypothetical protein